MSRRILAATCLVFVAFSFARADEAFIFRVRKATKVPRTAAVEGARAAVTPATYQAREGDTLWDVAGRFWSSPGAWPELWALNPHFRNPHRIDPGDPIFLRRDGRTEEVRLPVEAFSGGPSRSSGALEPKARSDESDRDPRAAARLAIRTTRGQADHFVSSHRIAPLGIVRGHLASKSIYATGDQVLLSFPGAASLKTGEFATIFDDSFAIKHPLNRTFQGYLVRVLGHVRIRSVSAGGAVGEIFETYDAVPEGAAVMTYRRPLSEVMLQLSKMEIQGVILGGMPEQTLLALEDVVFLDRGSIHGLEPGALLDIPMPQDLSIGRGISDLTSPIGRIVVVSAQDKTATAMILSSRAAVLAGHRFATVALSP